MFFSYRAVRSLGGDVDVGVVGDCFGRKVFESCL